MSYKIYIPEDYPKLVTGAWPCNADATITCEKKYVISGAVVTTSDGSEHSVPVSEFRVAPEGATLSDTDCHFVDSGDDATNLSSLEDCLKAFAAYYEEGSVTGTDSADLKTASEDTLEKYGYDKGETVALPSGSEIIITE